MLGKSLLVGIGVGIVATAFRWCIARAEETARSMYGMAADKPLLIALIFAGLIAVALIVGFFIRKVPYANSSGIPQTKGLITGQLDYSWWKVLLVKFFGTVASIFSGLSLGREGPAIQLGGCVGQAVGGRLGKSEAEKKILIAGGAGAGLGTVLGAPLAGILFSVEDMLKYFSPAIMICTMTSGFVSQFIAAQIFGVEPIFHLTVTASLPYSAMWILLPMGIVVGLAAVGYNRILLSSQKIYRELPFMRPWLKTVIPFVLAGILGLLMPEVLGGGEIIINNLDVSLALKYLLLLLAVKFCFFVICFDSGAPGGNLFPILVLGAIIGAVCGYVAVYWCGFPREMYANFVVFAMAAYFTAIARTPITGIVLVLETTGAFSELLPVAVVSLIAFTVSVLLKNPPIYDALLEARVKLEKGTPATEGTVEGDKCELEFLVQHGSAFENLVLGELPLPKNSRVEAIRRCENLLIPTEETRIHAGDYLIVLTDTDSSAFVYAHLTKMTSSD